MSERDINPAMDIIRDAIMSGKFGPVQKEDERAIFEACLLLFRCLLLDVSRIADALQVIAQDHRP